VVLAVSAIFWTQEVAAAMAAPAAGNDALKVAEAGSGKGALAGVAARCTAQLGEVVELVRGELSNLNRWAAEVVCKVLSLGLLHNHNMVTCCMC
jgi:hypothetical protein